MRYALLLNLLLLVGCATTNVTGYTDPKFAGNAFKNVTVLAAVGNLEQNSTLESRACELFRAAGVPCAQFTIAFPPTRNYTPDQVYAELAASGAQSLLILTKESDTSSSRVVGYQSQAAMYGNYASGTTVPLRARTRNSLSRVTLMDCATRSTAWLGDLETIGHVIATDDGSFIYSLADSATAALFNAGLFKRAE